MAPSNWNQESAFHPHGEQSGSHDAPPSTMATQLISKVTTASRPSLRVEPNDLQRLMNEVTAFEEISPQITDPERHLVHKHKLIYVVSRAVLEWLRDGTLMNLQIGVKEAAESLDVFILHIKEAPDVLAYVQSPDKCFQGRGSEPLWLWLFPRVLSLLGRPGCEFLTMKIRQFLGTSFLAVGQSPRLWNLSLLFYAYLKECALTTLMHLETPGTSLLNIVLPRDSSDYFPTAGEHNDDSGSICITYIIRDVRHGLCHATNILLILVDVTIEAARLFDATPVFQNYLAWLLDSLMSTHQLLKRWCVIPDFSEFCTSLEILVLGVVQKLLSDLNEALLPAMRRKGYGIFCVLAADVLHEPTTFSTELQQIICKGFLNLAANCRESDAIRRVASINLLPKIEKLLGNDVAKLGLSPDLKAAITFISLVCMTEMNKKIDESIINFEDDNLCAELERLHVKINKTPMERKANTEIFPPGKRRRMNEEPNAFDELISEIRSLLGVQTIVGIEGLSQVAQKGFGALSDQDRCQVVQYLGYIPCGSSGYSTLVREDCKIKCLSCLLCEGKHLAKPILGDEQALQEYGFEAIQTFATLIKSQDFLESRRARILAMIALRKFALHYDYPEFLDLEISPLAQWCFQSLASSMRELRVAASRTSAIFLRESANREVTKKNRTNALELLHAFQTGHRTHLQETCILTWGQIGRIVKDDDLNLVLLTLVQNLGHGNPVVSSVAFNEILRLAKALNLTVERLFSPYWGTVANEAVQDMLEKPTKTQMMADLLEISVAEFLLLTQSYTIPWLVMGKKIDVIKRISEARKDSEIGMACAEASNLVPTLALLMEQPVPDLESYIMSHLKHASSRFKDTDLNELLRVEPSSQALYLLKAAGDAHTDKKGRIYHALEFLAERAPTPDTKRKRSNPVGAFLEQHILGLITSISAVIIDVTRQQSATEKRRYIKALEELVKVAKSYTRVGRPQICACLQSALTQQELQCQAFSAWTTMLTNLDDDDVEVMLESTFSTVIQHWEGFDEATQTRAEHVMQYLLRDRSRLIRNTIVNLPSLATCARLSDIENQLNKLRIPTDVANGFQIFSRRLCHENAGVVTQAFIELKSYLHANQSFLQASAISEQPDVVIGVLLRSILDTCVKFNDSNREIAQISAECIGLIGCLDSNRVEAVRDHREMVVVSNFEDESETLEFVLFILQEVIVPAFLSATDIVLQGFLSYVMQELLEICGFKEVCAPILQNGMKNSSNSIYLKWLSLPSTVQDTLTPFLTSKYSVKAMKQVTYEYPIFRPDKMSSTKFYVPWLRNFVLSLLGTPLTTAAKQIFPPLCRGIRIKDISIANFLLPYAVLHVIVAGGEQQRKDIGSELLNVLTYEPLANSRVCREDFQLCIETVFRILDYLARWIQEKQSKKSNQITQPDSHDSIQRIKSVIEMLPPEIISGRAVECKSYARALFYWEQHIRDVREGDKSPETNTALLQRLQEIYTQIDEPDGIEGISAHLHVLDVDQQILGHRRAGRWTAAQSWYEIKLAEDPEDVDIQLNLLTCLKESGQHDVLLNYVEGMHTAEQAVAKLLPLAAEASWATGRWITLEKYTGMASQLAVEDFNVNIGRALLALHEKEEERFQFRIRKIREQIARSFSAATTSSLASCHDNMLKLHVLTELEMIAGINLESRVEPDLANILGSLNERLEVLGAYLNDKQYLLGIRRAAMQLSRLNFSKHDIATSWLTSARLARKGNAIHQSFNAVLHASQLGDESGTIEHARLLWREGNHRKAIQSLKGAIQSNAFISHNKSVNVTNFTEAGAADQQNLLTARSHLLLAKWLDSAGQTQSSVLRLQYQLAAKTHTNWEKGHYYLGRHYNKLLETEKSLPPELQNEPYLHGEMSKLVVENYLRALSHGTKYIYQTLPRVLTLWLELGIQVGQPVDSKYGNSKEFLARIEQQRKANLDQINARLQKYYVKLPAYMFYTALPQIVARIVHPNQEVFNLLGKIIFKVVDSYPQQAMWSLLAVCQSKQQDRRSRGMTVLQTLRTHQKRASGAVAGSIDMRALIKNSERLTNDLLRACESGDFHGNRTITCSLLKDLNFHQKSCLPSPMAVPVESVLTATLPTLTDNIRSHKAFSRDVVTITSFSDEVIVLSSLQKPRKLTARGSDGRNYGLMCKPKDDLRKDQRLMEFNGMINRSLKRDAEASRRQLYIKTYAVTPLNEECGIIEWVDGLKTIRDILLGLYRARGITPHYKEIESCCEEAIKSESKISFFTEKVLGSFPPVLYIWFMSQFPEPSAWFAARLRYTRSCAVMSMVGTILGLGDRHGENILFEEGNGGTFHVDFNCLFEKGLTFAKPERVPFRLTHNMVDAMGMYGYEGPFRTSCELTLKLLRQHQETLMTILEAFIYDPTLDLISKKSEKKRKSHFAIPDTAQGVLDNIHRKVRGLLPGESVPLGVEGQVDELIKQATNPLFLASMYIGWCSFL